jgi:uncharacterized protein YcbX
MREDELDAAGPDRAQELLHAPTLPRAARPIGYRSRAMARVARFNVTPVKSTALHHPDEVRIERSGAVGNREFFLVTEEGKLFGGSKLGALVRIRAEHDRATEILSLALPDGERVEGSAVPTGERLEVDFWGRTVPARLLEGPWAEALGRFAGRPLQLTLVSLASVAELARVGGLDGLDPRRFRMTVELHGLGPYEEDTWSGRPVRVGEVLLRVGERVPRCVVTTQDPDTGERDVPTLSLIKRARGLSAEREVVFGMYASVLEPGTVRVGDPVEPL